MNNDKKEKYADAFLELLKANSYDKITVNDICGKCGTFRANFYYHFKSKNDLARWIFDRDWQLMIGSAENIPLDNPALYEKIKEHRVFYLKALNKGMSDSLYSYIRKRFIAYICRARGLEQRSIDEITRIKLDYMSSGCIMAIHAWLEGALEMSAESFSACLYEKMTGIDLSGTESEE